MYILLDVSKVCICTLGEGMNFVRNFSVLQFESCGAMYGSSRNPHWDIYLSVSFSLYRVVIFVRDDIVARYSGFYDLLY